MSCHHHPTTAELTVAAAFVVYLGVTGIVVCIEIGHLMAVVLTVAHRVETTVLAVVTITGADSFDVGGEVKAEFHLFHLGEYLRLGRERGTCGTP